jgi:uncharacterized membrane protein
MIPPAPGTVPSKRPITVTVLAVLFILTGIGGLATHLTDFKTREDFLVALVRLLAIVAGAFMLRGHNWARWLAIAWIAFHVAISFLNSIQQAAVHALILILFAIVLFRPPANAYFRSVRFHAASH